MYDTIILEYEGQYGRGRALDDIVEWVEGLPPMPDVANRALNLVDDPNSSPSELATVLTRDPALVSTIMRAANSAALGRAQSVTTLDDAILVVGLGTLKSLILGVTLKQWNKEFGPVDKLVWEKSLGTAVAAFVLATFLGKTYQSEARLCALLHNLGQIVMLSHPEIRREYAQVLAYIRNQQVDFAAAEREIIGYSHPLVGAMVARKWKLPLSICTTILRYNDPFEGIANRQDEQIALIKLSAALAVCAGLGCPEGHPLFCQQLKPVAVALGFKAETLAGYQEILIRQTQALYATEAAAYR